MINAKVTEVRSGVVDTDGCLIYFTYLCLWRDWWQEGGVLTQVIGWWQEGVGWVAGGGRVGGRRG